MWTALPLVELDGFLYADPSLRATSVCADRPESWDRRVNMRPASLELLKQTTFVRMRDEGHPLGGGYPLYAIRPSGPGFQGDPLSRGL